MKLQVSFGKGTYKRDAILQKRPLILSMLLIVATPYQRYAYAYRSPVYILQMRKIPVAVHKKPCVCAKEHCITTKEACISAVTICVFNRSLYFVNCVMPVESRFVKVQFPRKCFFIQIHLFIGKILTIISISLMNGTSLASFKSAASSSSKPKLALILSFKTDSLHEN